MHKVRRLSCVLLSDEGPPGLPPSTANREAGPAAGGKRKARHTLAAWPGKTKRRLTIRTLDQRPQGRKLDCVDPDSFGELASALFKAEGERDREWFERHPARNYRVRRMTRGEMIFLGTPPGAVAYCAVRQLEPGARIRQFFSVTKSLESPIGERQAGYLWGWCAQTCIPPDVIDLFNYYADARC